MRGGTGFVDQQGTRMERRFRDRQASKARDVTHEAQGWPAPAKAPLHRRMIRRLFHLAFLLLRPMTLGVRGVVLDSKNRVLLVRHTYMSGWYFPGGGVEVGETSLQALERELREEAAIEVQGDPHWHGLFFNRHASRRDHVGLYIVRQFRDLGPHQPDREIAEVRFFALDALPPDLAYGHQRRLHEITHVLPASPEW